MSSHLKDNFEIDIFEPSLKYTCSVCAIWDELVPGLEVVTSSPGVSDVITMPIRGSCSAASENKEEISSGGSVEFEPIVDGTNPGILLSTEVVPRGSVEDEESVTDTSSADLSHYAATCLPRPGRNSLPSDVEMFHSTRQQPNCTGCGNISMRA
ncbi:hypothetical protein Aperf_G00000113179 [Anoplocephala perfoliata]